MARSVTATEPSYYYLLMAQTCFERSRSTADPARSNALCDLGRDYLMKATVQEDPAPAYGDDPSVQLRVGALLADASKKGWQTSPPMAALQAKQDGRSLSAP